MNEQMGKFITLEGIDCSGKGTQIKLMLEYFRKENIQIATQREPGGTPYGEVIRAIVKNPEKVLPLVFEHLDGYADYPNFELLSNMCKNNEIDFERTPHCELFLFEATRSEFCAAIKERLMDGENLLVDRYTDSTTAYQGGGRQLSVNMVEQLNSIATQGLKPNKTFFLDIPVKVMAERMKKNNPEENSFFEQKDRAFFQRVREGYLMIAEKEPARFIRINGNQEPEKVFEEIRPHLNKLFDLEVQT